MEKSEYLKTFADVADSFSATFGLRLVWQCLKYVVYSEKRWP